MNSHDELPPLAYIVRRLVPPPIPGVCGLIGMGEGQPEETPIGMLRAQCVESALKNDPEAPARTFDASSADKKSFLLAFCDCFVDEQVAFAKRNSGEPSRESWGSMRVRCARIAERPRSTLSEKVQDVDACIMGLGGPDPALKGQSKEAFVGFLVHPVVGFCGCYVGIGLPPAEAANWCSYHSTSVSRSADEASGNILWFAQSPKLCGRIFVEAQDVDSDPAESAWTDGCWSPGELQRLLPVPRDHSFKKSGGIRPSPAMRFLKELGRDTGDRPSTEQRCEDAGAFDASTLRSNHQRAFSSASPGGMFEKWELAEVVSRSDQYGAGKNQIVLQLVCLGGGSAHAMDGAVEEAHRHWITGSHAFSFDLCDYVTSGVGGTYCIARDSKRAEKKRKERLGVLTAGMSQSQRELVSAAYTSASSFFAEKAAGEEFHGGSGFAGWQTQSADRQKDDYIERIVATYQAELPKVSIPEYADADEELNRTYMQVRSRLDQNPISGFNINIDSEAVGRVQRLWVGYRDKTAVMLASLDDQVSEEQWKAILTRQRVVELALVRDWTDPG